MALPALRPGLGEERSEVSDGEESRSLSEETETADHVSREVGGNRAEGILLEHGSDVLELSQGLGVGLAERPPPSLSSRQVGYEKIVKREESKVSDLVRKLTEGEEEEEEPKEREDQRRRGGRVSTYPSKFPRSSCRKARARRPEEDELPKEC